MGPISDKKRNAVFGCNSFGLSLRNILHVSSDFLKHIGFSSISDSVLALGAV